MRELTPGQRFEFSPPGPITREMLRQYAQAAGDPVRLHLDADYARAAGWPDVIAHGMLSMAYLGHLLAGHFGPCAVTSWHVRFCAATPVEASVRCFAETESISTEPDGDRARLRIWTELSDGTRTLEGWASVAVGEASDI